MTDMQETFLAAYQEALSGAYPCQADDEIMQAFPQLFIMALEKSGKWRNVIRSNGLSRMEQG